MSSTSCEATVTPPHPRVLGWIGTSALAMGGSNQMIFLITALFVGQGAIIGQVAPPFPCWSSAFFSAGPPRLPGLSLS